MKVDNCYFDKAPTFVASIEPDLKIIKVGIPRTPNLAGVLGLSSIFILATFILPIYSFAILSKIGAIILQGPHHSAQ